MSTRELPTTRAALSTIGCLVCETFANLAGSKLNKAIAAIAALIAVDCACGAKLGRHGCEHPHPSPKHQCAEFVEKGAVACSSTP